MSSAMAAVDAVGYVASALVLTTFSMRSMVWLRVAAIASNVAFIGYAALAGIGPVLLLHVLLLPMNAMRLLQARRADAGSRSRSDRRRPALAYNRR